MHLPNFKGSGPRGSTTWKGVALAIALGVVLGTLLSATVVWLRPVPTGIASVEVIELAHAGTPGRSWVLELQAERAGYPFLVHLKADGTPSLLFPDGVITPVEAGERLRLPDNTGHRAWRSPPGSEGSEVYVTLSGSPYPAMEQVLARAERAAARASDGESARRVVRGVLREQLGPGVIVELPWQP